MSNNINEVVTWQEWSKKTRNKLVSTYGIALSTEALLTIIVEYHTWLKEHQKEGSEDE